MNDRIQQIKELRGWISRGRNTFAAMPPSMYVTQSLLAMELGFMWLGKLLGELGQQNPYPNSTDSSNTTVEPSADTVDDRFNLPEGDIERVKELRHLIQERMIDQLNQINVAMRGGKTDWAYRQAYIYLTEAKMWLGMELQSVSKKKPIEAVAE